MARERVQVDDLSPPERIRPAPVQSDTFAAPAKPIEDNSLGQLADALGFFNSNLQGFIGAQDAKAKAAKKERDIAHVEQVTAEWNRYRLSIPKGEYLQNIREGKVHYAADPFVGAVVRKHWATLEAEDLGASIDADIASGKLSLTDDPTNIERYILEKARPKADLFVDSADAMQQYRVGVDAVRDTVSKMREKVVADSVAATFDNITANSIEGVLTKAALEGASPDAVAASLRQVYQELGPRARGGALDQPYGRTDDILLKVLEDKSQDPRFAAMALGIIEAGRTDPVTGQPLGSLSSVYKNREVVERIRENVLKTAAKQDEEATKAFVLDNDVKALKRKDNSFNTIVDFRKDNSIDPSKAVTISASERKKAAVMAFLEETRTRTGGKEDFDREFDTLVKNGIDHPMWSQQLKAAYVGAQTSVDSMNTVDPSQVERITEAATLYAKISDRNSAWAEEFVGEKESKYFETFLTLTREAGYTPDQAAVAMARAQADMTAGKSTGVKGMDNAIAAAASNIDFDGLFLDDVANQGYVQQRIEKLADTLARNGGLSPEKAIELAAKRIQDTGFQINGHVVFGVPGFGKEDAPIIQDILKDVWAANRVPLEAKGYAEDQLGILPMKNGQVLVVAPDGMPIMNTTRDPKTGAVLSQEPLYIRTSDIVRRRTAAEDAARAKALQGIMGGQPDPMFGYPSKVK